MSLPYGSGWSPPAAAVTAPRAASISSPVAFRYRPRTERSIHGHLGRNLHPRQLAQARRKPASSPTSADGRKPRRPHPTGTRTISPARLSAGRTGTSSGSASWPAR